MKPETEANRIVATHKLPIMGSPPPLPCECGLFKGMSEEERLVTNDGVEHSLLECVRLGEGAYR